MNDAKHPRLLRNAIQTPDGTILESHNRHDYKEHVDAVTGLTYMVDGGLDYCRRMCREDQIDLNVYEDDSHEKIRESLSWGTYGKNGDQSLSWVLLKDMSDEHIQAVIDNCRPYPQVIKAMKRELEYRKNLSTTTKESENDYA